MPSNQELKHLFNAIRVLTNLHHRVVSPYLVLNPSGSRELSYEWMTGREQESVKRNLGIAGPIFVKLFGESEHWRKIAFLLFLYLYELYPADWTSWVVETDPWDEMCAISQMNGGIHAVGENLAENLVAIDDLVNSSNKDIRYFKAELMMCKLKIK